MNGKRAAAVAAAAAITVAGPASADLVAPSSAIAQAVFATHAAATARACAVVYTEAQCSAQAKADTTQKLANAMAAALGTCYDSFLPDACSWMLAVKNLAMPSPIQLGRSGQWTGGGGSYGGGGYSGTIGPVDCDTLRIGFDASGRLIVPSIPITGGGPITPGSTPVYGTNTSYFAGNVPHYSTAQTGAPLWSIHILNTGRGGDKRAWYGAYKKVGNTYTFSHVAHYNGQGALVSGGNIARTVATNQTQLPQQYFSWTYKPCPENGGGGADIDFIYKGGTNIENCIQYVKNYSLSRNGYVYGDEAAVPAAEWTKWPSGEYKHPDFAHCPLASTFIQRLAQALQDKAAAEPNGPPPLQIEPEDVKIGDKDPTSEDLSDTTTNVPATQEPSPVPSPTPGPTPTPTPGTGGTDYSHVPVNANEPTAPEIDWWPDLPTVSLSLGNPACPTYDMSVPQFGWTLTLDSHCPLIEANRAIIAAICMLIWSMGAILIVLRA